jgi:hypothetical protein
MALKVNRRSFDAEDLFFVLTRQIRRRGPERTRMAQTGSILVTGAAGQLGAVARTVTGMLLECGLPVRALVRREDERAAALQAAGAEVEDGMRGHRTLSSPTPYMASPVRGARPEQSRFSRSGYDGYNESRSDVRCGGTASFCHCGYRRLPPKAPNTHRGFCQRAFRLSTPTARPCGPALQKLSRTPRTAGQSDELDLKSSAAWRAGRSRSKIGAVACRSAS